MKKKILIAVGLLLVLVSTASAVSLTDTSNLDDLANAIDNSGTTAQRFARVRAYAQAQAAATQSQEAAIEDLQSRVAALEGTPPPPPPPPPGDTTAPSAPGNLRVTASSDSSITVAWDASSDDTGVAGYRVFRGSTQANSGSGLSYADSGLTCGTSYTYGVEAFDAAGNTSPRVSVTAPTADCSPPPPPPPSGCPVSTPNVPDGPDAFGGCFPGPKTTGVPAGTTLTTYTGPCTITAAGTVIDSKTVNCELVINAANVTIKNSKVNGNIWLDQDVPGSSGWSVTITDSEVVGPNQDIPTICCGMYTVVRVNAHGGHNGAQCENNNQYCTIRDSYLHNPYQPSSGDTHLGGFLSDGSDNLTLVHNTVWCNAPVNSSGGGCTGDINLIPNFSPINGALIDSNLLGANVGSAFCTYGGEKSVSQYPHSYNVKYRNNVFQRGTNGKCAAYGAVNAFEITNAGNEWTNNLYDDGTIVAPVN